MGTINQKYMVAKDRVDIYKDFAINLVNYILYYYIDYESINTDVDISNHFNWCFNKVCDEFEKEGIYFKNNEMLREYFYTYYYHKFYTAQIEPQEDTSLEYYLKFWDAIFEIDKQKNKALVNVLIEIYNVFDISINKEKNILDFI